MFLVEKNPLLEYYHKYRQKLDILHPKKNIYFNFEIVCSLYSLNLLYHWTYVYKIRTL